MHTACAALSSALVTLPVSGSRSHLADSCEQSIETNSSAAEGTDDEDCVVVEVITPKTKRRPFPIPYGHGRVSVLVQQFGIDNVITNSQKPLRPGTRRDIVSVVRRMYRQSGMLGFTRGWAIKVIDNSYHMAWMYGVGGILYQWIDKYFDQQQRHDK